MKMGLAVCESKDPLAKMCQRVLLFALLFLPFVATAQYYETGVDDNNIKWRQIKTSDFHIVYPDYYEAKAQELARVLHTSHNKIGSSLKVSSIANNAPFLLHPQSINSNGLVVWAPKRVELWTLEPRDTYPYPWLWQLALHEGRHTAQMKTLYQKGGGKALYSIFGEHIVGALLAIYVPYWFLEGDAVVAETALSPVGRGDSPEFDFEFKARILDKGKMKFDKAKMGSMKDFVPNRYNLGYHLVSFARGKYGKDIWGEVLEEMSSNFWKFSAWGETSEKGFKLSSEKLYHELIDSLSYVWKQEDSLYKQDAYQMNKGIKDLGKKDSGYANYYSPRFISNDSVLALRTSYFHTPQLVLITDSCETKIADLPFILDQHFDYSNGRIIFSQYYPDQRWQHTSFSDIVEYDLSTHKFNRLTYNQRLSLPYFNTENSDKFSAILSDTLGNINLTTSGYLIKIFPQGKAIVKQEDTKETLLIAPSYDNIRKLRQIGERIYYVKQVGHTYQLFSFSTSSNSDTTCHTNLRFGLSDFDIRDSMLVISDYTSSGYRIKTMPLANTTAIDYSGQRICNPDSLRASENFMLTDKNLIDTTFESSKYKKAKHLFNFHSFAPFAFSMENQALSLGISGLSQNLLGTSILQFGYKYRREEKRDDFFLNYYYKGFYPILNLQFDYIYPSVFKPQNTTSQYANELITSLNVQLPYQWFGFRFAHSFSATANIGYRNVNKSLNFGTIGLGATYQAFKPMALNDITPTLGEKISVRTLTTTGFTHNNIISAVATTYLPSLWANHSFELTASWQQRSNPTYYFSDLVEVTRGYAEELNQNPNTASSLFIGLRCVYNLPLCYPDWALWKLLYVKRIDAKPFYDCGFKSLDWENPTYDFISSAGSDILFHANFFRFETSIEIGARIGYMIERQSPFASLLLNFNF
ncbi:MAG: hypothetical protein LBO06_04510 [Bacteroidales bacterium]|jgi:hypothetical protein|nr:hypothetical protein [Bacteroidales bacterium]